MKSLAALAVLLLLLVQKPALGVPDWLVALVVLAVRGVSILVGTQPPTRAETVCGLALAAAACVRLASVMTTATVVGGLVACTAHAFSSGAVVQPALEYAGAAATLVCLTFALPNSSLDPSSGLWIASVVLALDLWASASDRSAANLVLSVIGAALAGCARLLVPSSLSAASLGAAVGLGLTSVRAYAREIPANNELVSVYLATTGAALGVCAAYDDALLCLLLALHAAARWTTLLAHAWQAPPPGVVVRIAGHK